MNLTIHLEETEERPPLADIATITVDTPDGEVKTFHATDEGASPKPSPAINQELLDAALHLLDIFSLTRSTSIVRLASERGLIDENSTSALALTYMIQSIQVALKSRIEFLGERPSTVADLIERARQILSLSPRNYRHKLGGGVSAYTGEKEAAFLLDLLDLLTARLETLPSRAAIPAEGHSHLDL